MQVGGKTSIVRNSKAIELKVGEESIAFTLTAVPLGWRERVQKIKAFNLPECPREPMKAANGKIVKGEDGLALVVRNESDPEYLEKLSEIGRRLRALKVYELLRNDASVKFSAVEPSGDGEAEWSQFCDDIFAEFQEFGLTAEELATIEFAGDQLSSRIDMQELKKHFLSDQAE